MGLEELRASHLYRFFPLDRSNRCRAVCDSLAAYAEFGAAFQNLEDDAFRRGCLDGHADRFEHVRGGNGLSSRRRRLWVGLA